MQNVWFVHATDCYYSGKINSNKFFLTTKFPFVQNHPMLMGWLWATLLVFIDRNTCIMNWLFLHLEIRGCRFLCRIRRAGVTLLRVVKTPILKNICERLLLKFSESFFWSWNIIILNQITVSKNNLMWCFKKMRAFGARKEKLVHEAGHVTRMKDAGC